VANDRRRYLRALLEVLTEPADTPRSRQIPVAARRRLRSEHYTWTRQPGIQGFGIGHKVIGPGVQRKLALRVYLEEKVPLDRVPAEWRIPPSIRVPGLRTPIPTDVIAVGKLRLEFTLGRQRPAFPGVSVSCQGSAGTFGLLVRRKDDANGVYILSNAHVLANSGLGHRRQDRILQPASDEGGIEPADSIATLWDFVDLEFTEEGFPNYVDAAIARVDEPSAALVQSTIYKLGAPTGVSGDVRIGMFVRKGGAATGATVGSVRAIEQKAHFWYEGPTGPRRAGFQDLTMCSSYSSEGDSGSAVLDPSGRVIGLHIGGSESTSFFCGIRDVFSLLGLTLA
jgi:hypothetical protein